jgi:hypothetical protein
VAANPDLTAAIRGVLTTLDPDVAADAELIDPIRARVHALVETL